jgi:hypothetical protein
MQHIAAIDLSKSIAISRMQIEIGISLETDFGSIADMAGLATSSTRSRITMRRFFARFSELARSVRVPSWAAFITTPRA